MNRDTSSVAGGIQPQAKAGHIMLALSILNEAKKDWSKGKSWKNNKLMVEVKRLFIRNDGSPVSYTHLTLPTTPYV